MTAIDKFIRLEAVGYWREHGKEPKEVIVSFGDATLQLATLQDVPLAHWALLATKRIGTQGERVIYSADPDERETLEIQDRDMIRAISAVTSALSTPARKPQWGKWLGRIILLAMVAAALSQSPPLIYRATTMLTSPARERSIAQDMRFSLEQEYGEPCAGWQGMHALDAFGEQLFPDMRVSLLVSDGQILPALALPNATVSLSREAVEGSESAEALAALAAVAWAASENGKPLQSYVESLGPFGALRYVITGVAQNPKTQDITPDGEDFITARYLLESQQLSLITLQKLAEKYGIGMPISNNGQGNPVFTFTNFEALQSICVK